MGHKAHSGNQTPYTYHLSYSCACAHTDVCHVQRVNPQDTEGTQAAAWADVMQSDDQEEGGERGEESDEL